MADEARSRLGRGLASLIGDVGGEAAHVERPRGQRKVPIEFLKPNPRNPRRTFSDAELAELTDSIRQHGVIQPIVARPVRGAHDRFEIIAGERRWRAAQAAGLHEVPIVPVDVSDSDALEIAIIENVQREDLNPMEEAEAFQRLLTDFAWTQEELGERVGKDRSSVANFLRLLRLPELIQADLRTGRLTMGHARALLSLTSPDDQLKLREQILAHSWSVRTTEESVQTKRRPLPRRLGRRSADLTALEDSLRQALATRVRVIGNERAGRIEIAYTSAEDLERLTELIVGRPA